VSISPSLYPNLEQLKKQAKDLRRAHGEGVVESALRLKAYVSRFAGLDEETVLAADLALRDAQHVIAREHGFGSWQDLRQAAAAEPAERRQLVSESVGYAEEDLLPVQILLVDLVDRSDGSRAAAVVLRTDDERIVVISIGEAEGAALARYLEGGELPRPMTHDLFSACLEAVEGTVCAVVVHELSDTTFLAHVVTTHGDRKRYVDARPSDCLNLAVRQQAPIFVTPALMEEAGRPLSDLPDQLQRMTTVIH
jgi:bifunctional DNase/RNase